MTANRLPGQNEQPTEIICHECGRFVGPLNRCPHCGAAVPLLLGVLAHRWFMRGRRAPAATVESGGEWVEGPMS